MAAVFCIDVGNTSAHWGWVEGTQVHERGEVATADCATLLPALLAQKFPQAAVSLASVVPATTAQLLPALQATSRDIFQLSATTVVGLGFDYPNPAEVGQDRLANCIGAQVYCGAPAIIVDLGTATTFDVLTPRGYAGGVIAPGLAVMTSYLHGRTALLPKLDPATLSACPALGKSTLAAMEAGCTHGFGGMMTGILDALLAELGAQGIRPTLLATGGTTDFLPPALASRLQRQPHLTLIGLAEAYRRARQGA